PNLENEQNFQLDIALELRNEHFEMYLNGFYNKINNYIFLNPTSEFINEDPVFEYLQNDAILMGGEAGLHIHPHHIHWLHIESNISLVNGEQKNEENLPLIPATSITNTLRAELSNNKFENSYAFVTLKTALKQSETHSFETSTPGYSLLSAGLGGDLNIKG